MNKTYWGPFHTGQQTQEHEFNRAVAQKECQHFRSTPIGGGQYRCLNCLSIHEPHNFPKKYHQ